MLVTIKVKVQVEPTSEERTAVCASYEPTPEVPEPDEEWICEEIAMRRLDSVPGNVGQDIVEVTH